MTSSAEYKSVGVDPRQKHVDIPINGWLATYFNSGYLGKTSIGLYRYWDRGLIRVEGMPYLATCAHDGTFATVDSKTSPPEVETMSDRAFAEWYGIGRKNSVIFSLLGRGTLIVLKHQLSDSRVRVDTYVSFNPQNTIVCCERGELGSLLLRIADDSGLDVDQAQVFTQAIATQVRDAV